MAGEISLGVLAAERELANVREMPLAGVGGDHGRRLEEHREEDRDHACRKLDALELPGNAAP